VDIPERSPSVDAAAQALEDIGGDEAGDVAAEASIV